MKLALKTENLAQLVYFVRGEKVMVDADLAMLYGVEARSLNQAVARNRRRFPPDFMFQLSAAEYENIRRGVWVIQCCAYGRRIAPWLQRNAI